MAVCAVSFVCYLSDTSLYLLCRIVTLDTLNRSDQGCRSVSGYEFYRVSCGILLTMPDQKFRTRARWPTWYGQIQIQRKKTLQYRLGNVHITRPGPIPSNIPGLTAARVIHSALALYTNFLKQTICYISCVPTSYVWKATRHSSKSTYQQCGPPQIIVIDVETLLVY